MCFFFTNVLDCPELCIVRLRNAAQQLSHKAAKYFSEPLQSRDKGVITAAACILVLSRHDQTYLHQCGLQVGSV